MYTQYAWWILCTNTLHNHYLATQVGVFLHLNILASQRVFHTTITHQHHRGFFTQPLPISKLSCSNELITHLPNNHTRIQLCLSGILQSVFLSIYPQRRVCVIWFITFVPFKEFNWAYSSVISFLYFRGKASNSMEFYVDFLYPLPSLMIISSTTIRKMCLTHFSLTPVLLKEALKYLIFWEEKCEEMKIEIHYCLHTLCIPNYFMCLGFSS